MIPARIRQILKATAVTAAVVLLYFLAYDRGAAIAFAATTLWMMANMVIWSLVLRMALNPGESKVGAGTMLAAVSGKLALLLAGVVALRIFAPYTKIQIYAIVAGVSSILIVSFLKALGSRIAVASKSSPSPASVDKEHTAKV